MKKSVLIFSFLSSLLCTVSFAASLQSLGKKDVTQSLLDKTVTTIMVTTLNNQIINDPLTVYFGKDGKIKGQFANKPDQDQQTDEGMWMVKPNGMVCVTWQHWNAGKIACVDFYKLKNGLLLVNPENNHFSTFILNEQIKSGNQM